MKRPVVLTTACLLAFASSAQARSALTVSQAKHAIHQAWYQQSFEVRDLRCQRQTPDRVACADLTQFPGVKSGYGVDTVTYRARIVAHLDRVRYPKCKVGYVRKTVQVKKRIHGKLERVKEGRCVRVKPKATTTTTLTAPTAVRAGIDPSYAQDPTDNLRVTWTYAASASGTLPDGTLSLTVQEPNKAGSSGGCTMNVGGTVTGGTCTQELPHYGDWNVTVSYVGSDPTVAPASSTDTEDIEPLAPAAPLATTTTLGISQNGGETDYAASVRDQSGSATFGTVEWVVTDTNTNQTVATFYDGGVSTYFRMVTVYTGNQQAGRAIAAYGRGQSGQIASGDLVNPSDSFVVQAIFTPAGGSGDAGSSSAAAPLVLTP